MLLLDLLSSIGRFLEYKLTGHSDFRLTIPFAETRTIRTDLEGRLQLDSVRQQLWSEFGIKTKWPILLEVKAPPPRGWKGGFYHSEGNLGRYQVQNFGSEQGHQISVRPNMPTLVFRAILAHELVHAYQSEHALLRGNQALREGMARWVEYHFLKAEAPEKAKKLLKVKHFTFGKSITTILTYEQKHGRRKTSEWLKKL